jgi:N-acetylglutamate synthase/N-acetylornithine aminotransferase
LHLLSPKGFQAAGVKAGIKSSGKLDVGLLLCDSLATAAAVFTANKVVAAPVVVGREHVAGGKLRGVIVNAGNANACTGRRGEKDARSMCELTGRCRWTKSAMASRVPPRHWGIRPSMPWHLPMPFSRRI